MFRLLVIISLLLSKQVIAQNSEILVSIVNSNLVFHSLETNDIKYVALSSSSIQAEKPRTLDYNPDKCEFYIITAFRSTPKLYRISIDGEVSKIGDLNSSDGSSIYSCEAITYNETDKKLYGSISFPSGDFYTESIAEINVSNAVCTKITTISTNTPSLEDCDFMDSYNDSLIIADGDLTPFFYIFNLPLAGLPSTSYPSEIYSDNLSSSAKIQELAVIKNFLYLEREKSLYKADLTQKPLTLVFDRSLNYAGFNPPLTALTNFNYSQIFSPIALRSDTTICQGDSIVLNVSGYQNFIWNDAISNGQFIKQAGEYYGFAQIDECLFRSDTFELKIKQCVNCNDVLQSISSSLKLGNDSTLCINDSITFTLNVNADSIVWSNGERGKSVEITNGVKLFAKVYIDSCVFNTDTITLTFVECKRCSDYYIELQNELTIGMDYTICEPQYLGFNKQSLSIDSLRWFDGDTSRVKQVKSSTSIYVTFYVDTCVFHSDTINLSIVNCDACSIEFPNAFTPNYDNLNELFRPVFVGDCEYEIIDFAVYNRWGEKLYESNIAAWDGIYKGKLVQQDVYVYTVSYLTKPDNFKMIKAGNIHVLY